MPPTRDEPKIGEPTLHRQRSQLNFCPDGPLSAQTRHRQLGRDVVKFVSASGAPAAHPLLRQGVVNLAVTSRT